MDYKEHCNITQTWERSANLQCVALTQSLVGNQLELIGHAYVIGKI